MKGRTFSFKEILEAAAKPFPQLWNAEGKLNLAAVARLYKERGYPVSQPTLFRLCTGKHKELSTETIDATHHVFRVPRSMLRQEPMTAEMEKLLADYRLSTLLLAQKLEGLPKEDYQNIVAQIERAHEQRDRLERAMSNSNVTVLDRSRR